MCAVPWSMGEKWAEGLSFEHVERRGKSENEGGWVVRDKEKKRRKEESLHVKESEELTDS
jgi:hypothetical protein